MEKMVSEQTLDYVAVCSKGDQIRGNQRQKVLRGKHCESILHLGAELFRWQRNLYLEIIKTGIDYLLEHRATEK